MIMTTGVLPAVIIFIQSGGATTATTRLIPHHISSGKTILESMQDRFDYGKNPEKTLDGALSRSYECDPITADAEFLLSKAK